jgi:two-component system LytT family sensor kinase
MDSQSKNRMNNRRKLRKRVPMHILFWLCYYIYDGPVTASIEAVPFDHVLSSAIALPLKIITTYFTLYLITRVYNEYKSPVRFFVIMFLSMLFFGSLQRIISYTISYPNFYPQGLNHPLWYLPKIAIEIFGLYSVVAIVATIHFIKQWYISQQEKQQFKSEQLQAELKYLKAQVHPHFLFNTLNNLYSLTINGSKKAPEVVFKLAELMSYMLYDSNKPLVPLQKEIDYIEDYITLEKLRYDERLDVSLNVHADLSAYCIAPLIILPFIENSFKHGCSNEIGSVWVHIDILANNGQLIFKIENSKGIPDLGKKPSLGGLGLQNVRQRLNLIYKDSHKLQFFDEDTYLVILKLDI